LTPSSAPQRRIIGTTRGREVILRREIDRPSGSMTICSRATLSFEQRLAHPHQNEVGQLAIRLRDIRRAHRARS
jgi:hypothetical protein